MILIINTNENQEIKQNINDKNDDKKIKKEKGENLKSKFTSKKIIFLVFLIVIIGIVITSALNRDKKIYTSNGLILVSNEDLISIIDEENTNNYNFSDNYLYTYFDEEKIYYLNPDGKQIDNEYSLKKDISNNENPIYFQTKIKSKNEIKEISLEYDLKNLSDREIEKNDIVFCAYANLIFYSLYYNDSHYIYDYDMFWEDLYDINPVEYKNKDLEKNLMCEKAAFLYTIKDGKIKLEITAY